jgi:hypothetical protein
MAKRTRKPATEVATTQVVGAGAVEPVQVQPAPVATATEATGEAPKAKRKRRGGKPKYVAPEGAPKIVCESHESFTPPEGYDVAKMSPLRPVHFASRADYHEYSAWRNLREFEAAKRLAEKWRTQGPQLKARRKAERLRKQLAALRAELLAAGDSDDDVSALLDSIANEAHQAAHDDKPSESTS